LYYGTDDLLIIFLTLASVNIQLRILPTFALVNIPVKFELKAKHTYFFIYKKDMYVSPIRFAIHNKNPQINYTVKYLKKHEGSINKLKKVHECF